MTKAEWAQVEEQLKNQFSPVTLLCDDYRLTLRLSRIKAMSLGITFFVNDEMCGRWMIDDCEERRRFFRPQEILVYRAKSKRAYKGISAKALKSMGIDLKKTFTVYSFYWLSFRALKAHLIKHNKSIRFVPPAPIDLRGVIV